MSEARRLIKQGGITINGRKISDTTKAVMFEEDGDEKFALIEELWSQKKS